MVIREVTHLPAAHAFELPLAFTLVVTVDGQRFAATSANRVLVALRRRRWAVLDAKRWVGLVAAVQRHRLFRGQLGALLDVVRVDPKLDPFRSLLVSAPGAELDPTLERVGAVLERVGALLEQVVIGTEVPP